MTGRTVRTGRLLALVAVLSFACAVIVALPGQSATAAGCSTSYGGTTKGDSWSATEALQRSFYDSAGPTATHNCFRLTVDKHTDLQDHERITVNWAGAHVTGGRSLNPYGESGLPQEYPVVLMECRGVDPKDYPSGHLPRGAEAVSPQTCWTNTYFQRTSSADPGHGIWEQDAASHDDTDHIQGLTGAVPGTCNVNSQFDYLITPFLAANGKSYAGCSSQAMPPEATVSSVSIPNEVYAFTNTNGAGTFPFEVRTALENRSLGCSSTVPCTLEVIPVDGIDCDNPDATAACNETGALPPGQVNTGQAPQDAVAPAFWASASNWDRRVPVPLGFSQPPSVCTVAKAGQPVPFYGSELLDQAALQWIPAYCLNKSRFNWQDNVMPDDAAFGLMQGGSAAAAEVSARGAGDTGIGYAPTAATGWAIAFDIDKPGNAGQQLSIKLDPLLLAKLLTESYPGSTAVAANHPGFSDNPLSLNLDPDFYRLNPGLDLTHWSEAAATLLATSTTSTVMTELTSYIAADPKAMAFLDGKPEHDGPYTMRVNPAYRHIKLPVDSWPQLDTWQFKAAPNSCLKAQGSSMPPYMPLVANPTTSMQLVAQALLYNWPNVGTGCTGTGSKSDPYQLGRVAPQGVGNRFMLGVVTLGDAERYGLTTARLQASPGHFVGADAAGIKAALSLAKPTSGQRPFDLTQTAIRTSKTAYPGSMVVYTAAKTYGLPAGTAGDVAQFIRVSTTEGQVPGRGNGQLAAGYVPIVSSGVTKALYDQAQHVATAVGAQKAPPAPPQPPTQASSPASPSNDVPPATTPSDAPTAPEPSTDNAPPPEKSSVTDAPVLRTAAVSSQTSAGLLIALLGTGVLASLGALAGRTALWRKGLRWLPRRP
ncbi:MAG TPA: hypothetical protein VH042_11980 [Solirubrobacterales bacterium]|nr:hypothetical protein [Solirubrobacterales bacterium]